MNINEELAKKLKRLVIIFAVIVIPGPQNVVSHKSSGPSNQNLHSNPLPT
ncbi:MAG: hypothetical protein IIC75_03410 [Bacteroidetes bacterium]|nr:hypothetical protein [Bacteroidota bacterium]